MINLPISERNPKITKNLCQCRPVCKNRRREWKGQIQNTSAELLLERKPIAECHRRRPSKVCPNGPCPLLGRTRRIAIKERNTIKKVSTVRICQAPVDDQIDTPYLEFAELARKLGAWSALRGRCAFCTCESCCPCNEQLYTPRDADRAGKRRGDMRQFDARVKKECVDMKIMYNI